MTREDYLQLKDDIRRTEGKERRYEKNNALWARAEQECSPQQLGALTRMARQINDDMDYLDMKSGCL